MLGKKYELSPSKPLLRSTQSLILGYFSTEFLAEVS